ncbi:MAG: hypothetical protein LUH04_00380, partial [Clostridium sp.]|nr:hypothetical protein [Clostridium sp.]
MTSWRRTGTGCGFTPSSATLFPGVTARTKSPPCGSCGGLQQGESILHTAHRTTTSHAARERLCSLLDKVKIEYKAIRATGRENIRLAAGEGRLEFRTRSSKGGLGEGFDLLVIDEAQEYTNDQESALKYVVTDSRNPQILFCG